MIIQVSHESFPGFGEDAAAFFAAHGISMICCADGCGGAGCRKLANHHGKTAAAIASQTAVRAFSHVSNKLNMLPETAFQTEMLSNNFMHTIQNALVETNAPAVNTIISGSFQKSMPTTFCGVLADSRNRLLFLSCGDSRGYTLDRNGLHQYTTDDLKNNPDAFQSLYSDVPLSHMLTSDNSFRFHTQITHILPESIVITATDGAYNALATPMEWEFLLLETLHESINAQSWKIKLDHRLAKIAQDDATILLYFHPGENWDTFKSHFEERRTYLQKRFITPIRRHKGNYQFAEHLWQQYRTGYECQGELIHAENR